MESFLAIGIVSLAIFVIVELELTAGESGKQPLLDLRVFRSRTFAGSNIAMATIVFALFGGNFLVPQYLQNLRGLSAYDAGLVMLPQALGSMVASLIGGRLVDKLGVKAVVLPGLLILATALWGFAHITLQTPSRRFSALIDYAWPGNWTLHAADDRLRAFRDQTGSVIAGLLSQLGGALRDDFLCRCNRDHTGDGTNHVSLRSPR